MSTTARAIPILLWRKWSTGCASSRDVLHVSC